MSLADEQNREAGMKNHVTPAVQTVFGQLLRSEKVQKALAFLERDQDAKIAEIKEMVLLHGAPFKEGELRTPENPRTTYTVGAVSGGGSVNTIANEGRCEQ